MGKLVGTILRVLFAWIDGIISLAITLLYKLLSDLAQLILYSDNIVKVIGQRIGLILGIFMLFRLAISLINYMISPDKINDKAQGGGKLIANVVFSLILLGTINVIFETAYKVQNTLINSQIIEKVFFGKSSNLNVDIGYYLYSGFFTPNPDSVLGKECNSLWDLSKDVSEQCNKKMESNFNDDQRDIIYNKVRKNMEFYHIFPSYSIVLADDSSGEFLFSYTPILSSAAGIAVLLVLISFSMDLATRAVKLLFLQIVAPVPIIFNMDPGKGKDVFQKWYKECFSTYIGVFLRLLAINFAVFIIVLIKGNFSDIFQNNFLLNVFIIIGCLMFAKQVPKLLETIFGIKTDGMSLKPLKKFQDQALFGKQISTFGSGILGAGYAGLTAGLTNGIVGVHDFTKNRSLASFGNIIGSTIGGFASATARGTLGAFRGEKFGKNYKSSFEGAMKARVNRDDRQDLKIKSSEVFMENLRSSLYLGNNAQVNEAKLKHYDDYASAGSTVKQRAEGEVDKKADVIKVNGQTLGALRDYYEQLKNSGGPSRSDIVDKFRSALMASNRKQMVTTSSGRTREETDAEYSNRINGLLATKTNEINQEFEKAQMAHAEATAKAHKAYFGARKIATNAYVSNGSQLAQSSISLGTDTIEGFDSAFASASRDEIVESNLSKMETLNSSYDMGIAVNRADIGSSVQTAQNEASRIRGSAEYGKAQLIQQQAQKEKR